MKMKFPIMILTFLMTSSVNAGLGDGLVALGRLIFDASKETKRHAESVEKYFDKLYSRPELIPFLTRTPLVISCDRSTIKGVGWHRVRVRIWEGVEHYRDCDVTMCDWNGKCQFELRGDGGFANWRFNLWQREGSSKKICWPQVCSKMS